jgi:hypothetical protein
MRPEEQQQVRTEKRQVRTEEQQVPTKEPVRKKALQPKVVRVPKTVPVQKMLPPALRAQVLKTKEFQVPKRVQRAMKEPAQKVLKMVLLQLKAPRKLPAMRTVLEVPRRKVQLAMQLVLKKKPASKMEMKKVRP